MLLKKKSIYEVSKEGATVLMYNFFFLSLSLHTTNETGNISLAQISHWNTAQTGFNLPFGNLLSSRL
jgi:hypothetical protein